MDHERIEELFAPLGPVAVKRMFGVHGIFCDGVIFAIDMEGEIYLKADAETKPLFEAAGSRPFVYRGKNGPVALSYFHLPVDALDDVDELQRWARLALDAARRAAAVKSKNRKK